MNKKKDNDKYSDEETERRAMEAIQHAFATPYKPQKEMVGKVGRPSGKSNAVKKRNEKS